MDTKLQDLYKAALLRHSRAPQGQQFIENASHEHFLTNSLCGDEVHLYLSLKDGEITKHGFQSQCCSICRASASILMERLQDTKDPGRAIFDAQHLIDALREKDTPSPYESSDDRSALFGVKAFPFWQPSQKERMMKSEERNFFVS